MEIAENEEINTTNPINTRRGLSSHPQNVLKQSKKLDTFFVSYFLNTEKNTFLIFLVLNVFKSSEIAGSVVVR